MMVTPMRMLGLWMTAGAALAAAPGPAQLDDYTRASSAIELRIALEAPYGRLPRMTDPAVASLFRTMLEPRHLTDPRPAPQNGVTLRAAMCRTADQIAMSYLQFGIKPPLDAIEDWLRPEAGKAQRVRNIVSYQAEIIPVLVFATRCRASVIPDMTAYVATLAPASANMAQRAGLSQLRESIPAGYVAAVTVATESALSVDSRRALFAALGETAQVHAAMLPLHSRQQAHDGLARLMADMPSAFLPQVSTMLRAFASKECTGFCPL